MVPKSLLCAFALLSMVAAQNFNNDDNNNDDNNNDDNNNFNNNNGDATLNQDAIQTGSFSDGQDGNAEEGQAASETSQENFINFCSGQTLTNGLQIEEGSCNGIGKFSHCRRWSDL